MKGLKEFIEDLAKDNKLREKFKDLKDVKEIVSFAEKEGYEFTEDEYMDKQMENVSGGFSLKDIIKPMTKEDIEEILTEPFTGISAKPYFGTIEPIDSSRLNIPIENVTGPGKLLKFLKGNE